MRKPRCSAYSTGDSSSGEFGVRAKGEVLKGGVCVSACVSVCVSEGVCGDAALLADEGTGGGLRGYTGGGEAYSNVGEKCSRNGEFCTDRRSEGECGAGEAEALVVNTAECADADVCVCVCSVCDNGGGCGAGEPRLRVNASGGSGGDVDDGFAGLLRVSALSTLPSLSRA